MSWKLSYDPDLNAVCCAYDGHVTADEFKASNRETIALAKKHSTYLLLIDDSKLESAVTTTEIYNMPKVYSDLQGNRRTRLAIILPPTGAIRKDVLFYETVCRNHGWKVKAFDNRSEAAEWLLKHTPSNGF